ncbi:MAG: 2,4-dihydroxyhept-2-ene-1,7-dioic acid aldolase [Geminicoccaceae bacterium]|nr:2,4-dihydroxyhept-2-ene-1,7-dioic acid aldolase [Geminicoccaceae bacterium]
MRANGLRLLWAKGGKAVNGWCAIPAPFAAEVMAHQGWDSLVVDMQHGVVGYESAVAMLQAISTTDTVPLVRVPWLEPGIVMKMLDAGAMGIVCPMVNTADEAKRFAGYCRYPPQGVRSFGPIRATLYAGADYPEHANAEVLALAMIETEEALSNLEAILDVDGLDGVYIGPADLAASLGAKPGFDPTDGRVLEAIGRIVQAAKERGRFACVHTGSPDFAKRMFKDGFDLATISSDARCMAAKAQEILGEMKAVDETDDPGLPSSVPEEGDGY